MSQDKPDDLTPRDATILRPRPGAGRRPGPAVGAGQAPPSGGQAPAPSAAPWPAADGQASGPSAAPWPGADGQASGQSAAPWSAGAQSAAPPPAASFAPLADFSQASTNPLVQAAVPLLVLAGRLRGQIANADIESLRRQAIQEMRSFEDRARQADVPPEDVLAAR